jgi:hypothetical protein
MKLCFVDNATAQRSENGLSLRPLSSGDRGKRPPCRANQRGSRGSIDTMRIVTTVSILNLQNRYQVLEKNETLSVGLTIRRGNGSDVSYFDTVLPYPPTVFAGSAFSTRSRSNDKGNQFKGFPGGTSL